MAMVEGAGVPLASVECGSGPAVLPVHGTAGGAEAGVDAWLDARGEPADSLRRVRARADHAAVFADYGGLATWPVTRGELRALTMPLAVLTSPGAAPAVREAADAVAGLVPGARREEAEDPAPAVRALLAEAA